MSARSQEAIDLFEQGLKRCSKCKVVKPLECFSKDKNRADGLESRCKDCAKIYNATRINDSSARWKAYSEAHAKERKVYFKAHNQKPQRKADVKAYNNNHRAAKQQRGGRVPPHVYAKLFELQQGKCLYCLIELQDGYHVDHVVPLSRGGSNTPTNLACACASCNLSKNAKTLGEFTQDIEVFNRFNYLRAAIKRYLCGT